MFWSIIVLSLFMIALASISDIKTREIPDYVNFSFLVLAFVLRLIWGVSDENVQIFIIPLIISAITFGITYLSYYFGHWGGGDTKLITACAMTLGWFPEREWFFLEYIINLLFAMVLYSTFFVLYIAGKNYKKVIRKYKKQDFAITFATWAAAVFGIFALSIRFESVVFISGLFMAGFIPVIVIVDREFMVAKLRPSELTIGDWLITSVKVGEKTVKPRRIGITENDLKILKNYRGRIKVKNGVPLAPAFIISLLLAFSPVNFSLFLL